MLKMSEEDDEIMLMNEDDDVHLEKSSGVDPLDLLKMLEPQLNKEGGINTAEDVEDIVSLMKETNKLVARCTYINILKATKDTAIKEKFISEGGWDVMFDWLQEAKSDNDDFLTEILKVYQQLPVTVDLLKKNSCAKVIKQLGKSDKSDKIKKLSGDIVDTWMKKIKTKSGSETSSNGNDSGDKSRSKHKKSSRDKDGKERDEKESNHHHHHHHHHSSHNSNKDKSSKSSSEEKDSSKSSSEDSKSNSNHKSVSFSSDTKKGEPSQPRAKTVKAVPTKFRSTGLEQAAQLPAAKKKKVPTATLR